MAATQAPDSEPAIAAVAGSLADMLLFLSVVSPKRYHVLSMFGSLDSTRRHLLAVVNHPTSSAKNQKLLAQGFKEVKRHLQLIERYTFHSHANGSSDILASVDEVTITANDAAAALLDLNNHVDRLQKDLAAILSSAPSTDLSTASPALSTDA